MISILIPTYNYNCVALVNELQRQITADQLTAEVIVLDDASTDENLFNSNRAIDNLPNCRWEMNETNMGRSRTRNKLASMAQYEYLVFLDCDVMPVYTDFLSRYIAICKQADAANGGLAMHSCAPSPQQTLRHKYGCKVEVRTVKQRRENPFTEFLSSNLLISSRVFASIQFNEKFTQYGHEDTLLGQEMKEKGYHIIHIDNPVYHEGIESNDIFLAKTRQGLENLVKHRDILQSHTKLLAFYNKIELLHLTRLIAWGYRLFQQGLTKNLQSNRPSLTLFNIYKVGYLCHIMALKDRK